MTSVHDLHLKPISHRVAVSIQEMASHLTDELISKLVGVLRPVNRGGYIRAITPSII